MMMMLRARRALAMGASAATRAASDGAVATRATPVGTTMMDNASSMMRARRAYGDATTTPPLLVAMMGVQRPLNVIHRMIENTGAEIKESRNVSLGGRSSNMFLVTGADPMALKREFANERHDFFSVYEARNTIRDIKGPYCETSPLLPFVRRATLQVPYKPGVVNEIADFLCSKGVTLSHLDEYRSGKDVVLEAILHLPTGLAEFPAVEEAYVLKKLESLGVSVREFGKVEGRPRTEKAATS